MHIGITGASGFIGSKVAALARERGHTVTAFSRQPSEGVRLLSNDQKPDLSGLDAVVNLAGEPIMGIWTSVKKRRIRDSRVLGTQRIVEAISEMPDKPGILINASAIGFYGPTGEHLVDETSPAGEGFLAQVCKDWEAEACRAERLGVRVVLVRIGFVLGGGGALNLMLPAFRLGLGGRLGDGRQWMSGVHVDDVAGSILWALHGESVSGAFNAVMPDPFRNEDFTDTLARLLHRPAVLPAPALLLRSALGELGEVMLESARVAPRRLMEKEYPFRFGGLAAALEHAIKRPN